MTAPEPAAVSSETVSRETLLALLPLPDQRTRRRQGGADTWWNGPRLECLRAHVIAGHSNADIAAFMATPDHPLTEGTIRTRLHRLGWVTKRQRPINRARKPSNTAADGSNAAAE